MAHFNSDLLVINLGDVVISLNCPIPGKHCIFANGQRTPLKQVMLEQVGEPQRVMGEWFAPLSWRIVFTHIHTIGVCPYFPGFYISAGFNPQTWEKYYELAEQYHSIQSEFTRIITETPEIYKPDQNINPSRN